LNVLLKDHLDLYYAGFVDNALQEVTEAKAVYAIKKGQKIPDPDELDVPYKSYLTGLGDTVGELRRFTLDEMRSGNIDTAIGYLEIMEDIYSMLMSFDYPNAVLPIKHKQDLARNLIEKTRSEIAVAVRSKALEEKIERLEKYLGTKDAKKSKKK
jgi:translin